MSHSPTVSLIQCESYQPELVRTAIVQLLAPFGGIASLVKSGERILLKPNLVTSPPKGSPACTHPTVVIEMAKLVREAGGHPVIGDSPAFGSAQRVAAKIGLLQAARACGFPLLDLGRNVSKSIQLEGKVFSGAISRDVLAVDGVINLPKFKAHRQATLTFGVKNLYGCVAGKRKACRHFASGGDRDWFAMMLVANAVLVAPRLTLVDGVIAMEGLGPVRGTPYGLHALVGGTDPVAVDTLCCQLVNYPSQSLCTNQAARLLGVGVSDLSQIKVVGATLAECQVRDFQFAEEIPIFFSLPQLARSWMKSWREKLAPVE